jgi:outer membrane protein OmpA-like peptidoglycan-associated protein
MSATRCRLGGRALALLCLAGGLAACAPLPENVVVLLEDPENPNASVAISSDGKTAVIDKPLVAVGLDGDADGLTEPIETDIETVRDEFAAAIDSQPRPPVKFVLYFELGGQQLLPDSAAELDAIARLIATRPYVDVTIAGHTDTVGAAAQNAQLSLQRAIVVRDLLVARGVNAAILNDVTSHGEGNPLVPTGDNVAEVRNRRVEVTVR